MHDPTHGLCSEPITRDSSALPELRHGMRRVALSRHQRCVRRHGSGSCRNQGGGHRSIRAGICARRVHRTRVRLPSSRREWRAPPSGRSYSRAARRLAGGARVRATPSGVDPRRVAIWGFSVSGGHVFRVAAADRTARGGDRPLAGGRRSRRRDECHADHAATCGPSPAHRGAPRRAVRRMRTRSRARSADGAVRQRRIDHDAGCSKRAGALNPAVRIGGSRRSRRDRPFALRITAPVESRGDHRAIARARL